MITRQQIDDLLAFQNGDYLVTSCYMNLDRNKMPAQMLKIRVKDLLNAAQHQLSAKTGNHHQRESLRQDFQRIEEHLMTQVVAGRHPGEVAFSCHGENLWQTFGLPRLVRNILIANHAPYIRPLTAILAEYHRFCVAMVDRAHGQIFEVYLQEIVARSGPIGNVARRIREGGMGGRDERNIERRHDHAVQQHYRTVAEEVFRIFQRDKFDWLILGGQREPLREFKDYLHPYLRARWVGDFHAEPSRMSVPEILQHALDIEQHVEWEHELKLADQLVQKADAGNRAVKGLGATLMALDRGEAQMLLVDDGFEVPGFACFHCHFAATEPMECPHCHRPTEPCADIVDEAIELAMMRNCQVEHLQGATALRDDGRIGALLRFQA